MDVLTRIVNCAEELVHIAVDWHVTLPQPPTSMAFVKERMTSNHSTPDRVTAIDGNKQSLSRAANARSGGSVP